MAEITFIEPDLDFVASIKENGGESLQKCYQCATCTVVCNVTHNEKPFPRKEMIWAQWGLKDRLINNPDVWLCYQCNDCSVYCPRGAKPSDVLAAIRNLSFKEFAVPSFLGKALSEPGYLALLFFVPIVILLFAVVMVNGFALPEGEIVFSKFLPVKAIDAIFIPVAIFVMATAFSGILRFWKGLNKGGTGKSSIIKSIVLTVIEILKHDSFKKCESNKQRYVSHLLTFYGFLGLFATTNLVMVLLYLFGIETPLPLDNPVKILGNASAISVLIGCTLIIFKRLTDPDSIGQATHFDWTFVLVLYLTVITGILSELFRLSELAVAAYSIYFVHLVFVFFLLAYAPFSKFAHIFYRTTAIVYSKYTNGG